MEDYKGEVASGDENTTDIEEKEEFSSLNKKRVCLIYATARD
jgi:hypothetical protein